jgi:hypothetical protein
MTKIATLVLFCFALVDLAGTSAATSATRQLPAATLPKELVEYFTGDWTGKGAFTNGKEIQSELSFVPIVASQSLLVRHKERDPNTFEFVAIWSVDSMSGDVVMLLASNHESGARLFRSRGWRDGAIVFQSVEELRANFALERFTFRRESATAFQSMYEMSQNGQTWQVGDRQTFTKR